jgi:hypothetical protein
MCLVTSSFTDIELNSNVQFAVCLYVVLLEHDLARRITEFPDFVHRPEF